jgi:flagellar basal body-associated protein FliL
MLEELQSLSDGSKKRVLVIATVIIMIIIVGVWVAYFNSIIMGTAQQVATEATTTSAVGGADDHRDAARSRAGKWSQPVAEYKEWVRVHH